jgi:phospholipid transport system substrate-binding protein
MNAAEGYVDKLSNSVLVAANAGEKARFASLMHQHADIRTIGLFSLGPYARKLPANQREQYYRLVENWIAKTFMGYSKGLGGQKFKIISSSARGNKITLVKSKIVGGSNAPVKWRLIKHNDSYQVSDVNVAGIWLSILMKSKFVAKLNKYDGDFNRLFAYLS